MNIQEYLDLFEYTQDDKSENTKIKEGYWYFKTNIIDVNNPLYINLSEVIRELDLDEDSAYTFTVEALRAIREIDDTNGSIDEDLEDIEVISNYSEAPIYTSELLEWVKRKYNYLFAEDYINDFGWDGEIVKAFMGGYSRAWQEHYFKVLEVIRD